MNALELTTRALTLLGVTAAGETPSAADGAEALLTLNGYLSAILGAGVGSPLTSIVLTSSREAEGNERFLVDASSGPITITTLATPADGARLAVIDAKRIFNAVPFTLDTGTSLIEGQVGPLVLSTAGERREWFYRADLDDWQRVRPLTTFDELPYPDEMAEGIAANVAVRLAPAFGVAPNQILLSMAEQGYTRLKARYDQGPLLSVDDGLLYPNLRGTWLDA